VQLALIVPYLAGTPYSSSRQFASEQISHIHNWVSTGMPVDLCKKFRLLPWCPSQHVNDLVEGQLVLEKLKEVGTKTEKLNAKHGRYMKNNVKVIPGRGRTAN
jgi:hypothetical protein